MHSYRPYVLSLLLGALTLCGIVGSTAAFISHPNSMPNSNSRRTSSLQPAFDTVQRQHEPITERTKSVRQLFAEERRKEWIDRSVKYYSKVMREERRRSLGQATEPDTSSEREEYLILAKKHYFALRKIKDGKPDHAESIYRRIINELSSDDGNCDHAQLAVTTLLLALHLNRVGDIKETRSVFLNFFRIITAEGDDDDECACSAKVLQAFALFEMKQGNASKSLLLALKAIQLDQSLASLLKWKQFRDVLEKRDARRATGGTMSVA